VCSCTLKLPDLANIRKWRVKDFDNYLVFYELRPDGVSIVRVLRAALASAADRALLRPGARDAWSLVDSR